MSLQSIQFGAIQPVCSGARVKVPATLANLGSGFDALGLALDVYLQVEATVHSSDVFEYSGQGQHPNTPDNLIHQGFKAAWSRLSDTIPFLRIVAHNPIPLARGMGSSSAALVAGAMLADVLSGGALGQDGVFDVAATLEGHPDNVGPAVYGGFVAAASNPSVAIKVPIAEANQLCMVLGIPNYHVPTHQARAVLPSTVAMSDAIFNLSRSALWVAALSQGRFEVLRQASQDRLHQQQRSSLMPLLFDSIEAAYHQGAHAAFVGGAGPTLAALCHKHTAQAVATAFNTYKANGCVQIVEFGQAASGNPL